MSATPTESAAAVLGVPVSSLEALSRDPESTVLLVHHADADEPNHGSRQTLATFLQRHHAQLLAAGQENRDSGMGIALQSVRAERAHQDTKWGASAERPTPNLAVLTEEVGEVAKAMLEESDLRLRAELVQVAAVAVAMVEGIDRGDVPRS